VPRWFPLFRTIHWRDITLLHKNNLVHTKGRTIWCSLCTLSISDIPKSLVLFASGGPWILVVAMNTTNKANTLYHTHRNTNKMTRHKVNTTKSLSSSGLRWEFRIQAPKWDRSSGRPDK
jgi:hypothetical protein